MDWNCATREEQITYLHKLRSDITWLIDKNDGFIDIDYKVSEFKKIWKTFVDNHCVYLESNGEGDPEIIKQYNEQVILTSEFEKKVGTWRDNFRKKKKEKSLFSSVRSSSSSVKILKQKESVAIAKLNLEKLKKQQEISRRISELQSEKEILEAERKAEEAVISLQILEGIQKDQDNDCASQIIDPADFDNNIQVTTSVYKRSDEKVKPNVVPVSSATEPLIDTLLPQPVTCAPNNVDLLTSTRPQSFNNTQSLHCTTSFAPLNSHVDAYPLPVYSTSTSSQFIPRNNLPVYNPISSTNTLNNIHYGNVTSTQNYGSPFVPHSSEFLPYNPYNNNVMNNNYGQPNINPFVSQMPQVNNDSCLVQKLCQVMSTPKLEYMHFDGNPLKYVSFMHNFEDCLEKQNPEDSRRLQLLIQHCTGKARESIESCVNLPSEIGYSTAKKTLQENFGRPHVIARAHLNKLESLPVLRNADGTNLMEFSRHLEIAYRTLSGMGVDYVSDLNHMNTLRELNKKLPIFLKAKWTERAGKLIESGMRPKFLDFLNFIKDRANLVNNEFGEDLSSSYSRDKKPEISKFKKPFSGNYGTGNRPLTTLALGVQKKEGPLRVELPKPCELCSKSHPIWKCQSFHSLSGSDRAKAVFDKELCLKCLCKGHLVKCCPKENFKCLVRGCGKNHNTLLHGINFSIFRNPENSKQSLVGLKDNISQATTGSTTAATGAGDKRVCLGVMPVKLQIQNSSTILTYALLDTGSELSLIVKSLVETLTFSDPSQTLTLTGITGSMNIESQTVNITVKSLDEKTVIELDDVKTVDSMPISSNCIPKLSDLCHWPHLSDIPYEELENFEIGLIIGVREKPQLFIPDESRVGGEHDPIALRYSLGWMILGPLGDRRDIDDYSVNFISKTELSSNDDLKLNLDRLWSTDFGDVGEDQICMSLEDKRALGMIDESLTRVDKHFQVALPWRSDPPYLPNNRIVAEQRVQGLKRRFYGNPDLFELYTTTIEDYIQKGHAERISNDMLEVKDKPVWYLPHHPVSHPLKPEKVRVVFDCAAKYRGTSLNQQLLQGPDFANQLVGVLMRFRQDRVGIVADIEAMFHQVRVDPRDCDAFRFLWWNNSDLSDDLVEYRMVKHIFGATSSPCIANYCLQKSAELFEDRFDSETIKTILRNMYVDDLMKAVNSVDSAVKLVNELSELLSNCGFHLTKWCSNDRGVLSAIPVSERAKSVVDLELEHLPTENALGLKWNTQNDSFVWKVSEKFLNIAYTKPINRRNILSVVASLFDPIGFIAPYIMKGKLILQMCSRKKLGWDDPVDETDKEQWIRWLADMKKLPEIEIGRCLFPKEFGEFKCIQLHMFSDASRVGYSAVAYLRFVDVEDRICCSFIIGKSRLAPVREISIPRLELSAAVISINLKKMIFTELELKIDQVIYWTDSRSVLKCIHNESKRFHTFESNRLTLIHHGSNVSEWRWVNRDDNPAGDGSKGLKLNSTLKNNRWLNGPDFLMKDEEYWARMIDIPILNNDDPEVRKEAQIYIAAANQDIINQLLHHYSSWLKLKRAVAWLLRLKSKLLNRVRLRLNQVQPKVFPKYLSVEEICKAEVEIVKLVQQEDFPVALKLLSSGQTNAEKSSKTLMKEVRSSLYKLNPYLRDNVLCVGGRLDNAPVDNALKHPLILPYKHFVTDLIINYYHSEIGHFGQESVLSALRQKFWIVKGRSAVRRVLSKCVECQRRKKRPENQFMADLPEVRLSPDKPLFTYVGVDFFGPLLVKQGRSSVKRYGCLFSCFNSRAVHIEIAHSLNTDSMINALRRFISLRGYPEKIYSDNGSNFTSADKELKEALNSFDQSRISGFCVKKDISWNFNPPAASHMGGVWERMIRSVRQILKSLLKEQLVCDEILLTVMAEVVLILNNRPLTRNSDSVMDDQPLTPNHLLHLRPCHGLPPGTFQKEDLYLKRKWRQAQYLCEVFWRRWVREYLPTLLERSKWHTAKRNVRIGDVVLLVDDHYPRGQWPLALIVDVVVSKDGFVRTVKLKTKSTVATCCKQRKGAEINRESVVLTRPVTKVCLLELD